MSPKCCKIDFESESGGKERARIFIGIRKQYTGLLEPEYVYGHAEICRKRALPFLSA